MFLILIDLKKIYILLGPTHTSFRCSQAELDKQIMVHIETWTGRRTESWNRGAAVYMKRRALLPLKSGISGESAPDFV